jgi:hypothetical protein
MQYNHRYTGCRCDKRTHDRGVGKACGRQGLIFGLNLLAVRDTARCVGTQDPLACWFMDYASVLGGIVDNAVDSKFQRDRTGSMLLEDL